MKSIEASGVQDGLGGADDSSGAWATVSASRRVPGGVDSVGYSAACRWRRMRPSRAKAFMPAEPPKWPTTASWTAMWPPFVVDRKPCAASRATVALVPHRWPSFAPMAPRRAVPAGVGATPTNSAAGKRVRGAQRRPARSGPEAESAPADLRAGRDPRGPGPGSRAGSRPGPGGRPARPASARRW